MKTIDPTIIPALKDKLLETMSEIGQMGENIKEAADWIKDKHPIQQENAALSLQSVAAGAEQAVEYLRAIALKCEEISGEVLK